MATVYRAFDSILEVDRAIKLLAARLLTRASIRQRFASEARTMARLRHPNIVTVYDVCNDENGFYIIMEYIGSGSVQDRVEHFGALPPQMACDVIIGLLGGLSEAHAQNIVHRDIKPHNLLITEEGVPKLTDFGIAHVAEKDRGLTSTGMVMGTLAYMSPEQKMSARQADARADLYSTTATLYAVLTGDEPFDLFSPPVQDEKLIDIPEPLATLIRRGCEYKPQNRYQTALEMIQALKDCKAELDPDPDDVMPLALPRDVMSERSKEVSVSFSTTSGHSLATTGATGASKSIPPTGGLSNQLSNPTFFDLDDEAPTAATINIENHNFTNLGPATVANESETLLPEKDSAKKSLSIPMLAAGGTGVAALIVAAFMFIPGETAEQVNLPVIAPASVQQAVEEPKPVVEAAPEAKPELVEEKPPAPKVQTVRPKPSSSKAASKPAPVAVPIVKAAPPKPVAPKSGFVKVDGKAKVELKRRGRSFSTGDVPLGTYEIWADWGDGSGMKTMKESIIVKAGAQHIIKCSSMTGRCRDKSGQ
jgi:serine/threonine-protein kinase